MVKRADDQGEMGLAATTPSAPRSERSANDETVDARPRRAPTPLDETADDVRATTSEAPAAPEMIGRFTVERHLGEGGMGVVLLAHDSTLDREVAIKLLRNDDDSDVGSSGRVRLLREAQAMARLRHPNVVTVFEAGIHQGRVYVVMEYLRGGTLRSWLTEVGVRRIRDTAAPRADWRPIVAMFAAAGRGLAAAHAAGLIHRDFKPENVLVDEHGSTKVTDFGLAAERTIGDEEAGDTPATPKPDLDALSHTLTNTGDVMGTPRYMAPEQHEGKRADARTDVFAFCVALYEALYEQHPFGDENYLVLRQLVLGGELRAPPVDRGEPERVREAIVRGLSHDPAARFSTMNELLAELEPELRPRRRALVWGGALGVPVLGIAALVLVPRLTGSSPEDERVAASIAMAKECDCELLTLVLPPVATVIGVRPTAGSGDAAWQPGASTPPAWVPTGQLAVPRGAHLIDYLVGGVPASFAVISRGDGAARTIQLPLPERRDGYVFVAGGEVTIGDERGESNQGAPATVTLAPYLIATAEVGEGGVPRRVSHTDAVKLAYERHARFPTGAEWEWAARLGGAPGMLGPGWEWTANQPLDYPYASGAREDPFQDRDVSEVRGGRADGDAARQAIRRSGFHSGRAELRLARSARTEPVATTLEFATTFERMENGRKISGGGIRDQDLVRVHRYLMDWIQLDDPRPPLQVTNLDCTFVSALARAGIPMKHVERIAGEREGVAVIRRHPDPSWTPPSSRRFTCTETKVEALDVICFDRETLVPSSNRVIDAVATSLLGNPQIKEVEVTSVVLPGEGAAALAEVRANAVRAALIQRGVQAGRLRARGHVGGAAQAAGGAGSQDEESGLFAPAVPTAPTSNASCPTQQPGEAITFEILKR